MAGDRARVRVKICGITNRDDAEAAIAAGTDALGFNLWAGSKRGINFDENVGWIAELPPFVTRVAVMVNPTYEEARRVAESPAIDLVQFHGDESPDFLREFAQLGRPFIAAIRLNATVDPLKPADLSTSWVLVDAAVPGAYGGTGHAVDLSLARRYIEANPRARVILAGGLNETNVRSAVHQVRPYAVDVASGVEGESPRRKDAERMRQFVAAALG